MDFKTTIGNMFGFTSKVTAPAINAFKTAATQKNDGYIITQIVNEFKDRSRSEIKKWRQALDAAEDINRPRWYQLQDLYDNLMSDGHLMACIQIRKSAVLSNRFIVKDIVSGNVNIEQTQFFKSEWFFNLMEHLLDATYKGYTVVELADSINLKFKNIPRRNIVPQLHEVLLSITAENGIDYLQPMYEKNILELVNIEKFGIINDIVPDLIFKRNAKQAWADLSERFGIPMVTASTTRTDKKDLDRIESLLKQLGQAAQAVLPEGTNIVIHDSAGKGDPYQIFKEQITTTNEEVSKRILGGTMLTDSGSSRSQSEVHERTFNDYIAEADFRTIEFFVNDKLRPLLANYGINNVISERFEFDRSEELTLKEHWDIVNQALAFYEVDTKWVSSRFNMPILNVRQQAQPVPNNAKAALTKNFQ